MDQAANTHAFKANSLRTPQQWSDAWYIYTQYPSQSELEQADQHDELADKLWEIAQQAMNAAAEKQKGTPAGFNYAAIVARRAGNTDEAIADLQQSLKLAPEDRSIHDELADLYESKGMQDEAVDERTTAINLVQTTAAPLLRSTWPQIAQTKFKHAKAALARAMAVDPADARAEAYLGMIAVADQKADDALPWFMTAAAIEEANARLSGRSGTSNASGSLAPVAVGLGMAIDMHAAKLLLMQKKPADALRLLKNALSAGNRVPVQGRYVPVASSMLPGDNFDPTTEMPVALNMATLMAWAHVRAAQAMSMSGDDKGAEGECAAAMACQTSAPPTVDVGMPIRMPVALAAMVLGKSALDRGDAAQAVDILSGHGIPYSEQNKQFWQEYNDLMNQAVQAANRLH
ncbi:MAG: hypothetical protein JO353_06715 [Phycisphaerae bacterium]|nr:hypothetical protein [Phycisphaerae bacterium]